MNFPTTQGITPHDFPAGRGLAPPVIGRTTKAGPHDHRVKCPIAPRRILGHQWDIGAAQFIQNSVDELKKNKCSPEKFYADGGYGSDDNFVYSAANGVDLISPTHPIPKDKVGLDESKFDKKGFMIQCPAGKSPMLKKFKNGSYRAIFHITACGNCPLKEKCRSEKCGKQNRQFKYKESDIRTLERREIEKTSEFKEDYSLKRIPIEGLNGRLKQYTQLRRLRVRGKPAVFHSILAILAMHNIMQAARHAKIQTKKAIATAVFAFLRLKIIQTPFYLRLQAA